MPQEQTTDDKATRRRSPFRSNIRVGASLDTEVLQRLATDHPEAFVKRVQAMIDGRTPSGERKLSWSSIRSLQRMFDALWDVKVPVEVELPTGGTRAIEASAFPIFSGLLTIAGMQDGYDEVPNIGDKLVREMEDNKRVSIVAGLKHTDVNMDEVPPEVDFPEIGAGEKAYHIRSRRNGRRISIRAEMIEENDIAGIVSRVNALGAFAADYIEELTLARVTDLYGSKGTPSEPYVLRPDGTGTALYSATANTPGVQAPLGTRVNTNVLADETDLAGARRLLAAMLNDRQKRMHIPMSQCQLLVPDALVETASKILNSELKPGSVNEYNAWGPGGQWRPELLSSPKLDDLSTTTWYLGNFPKQFKRKWKLRFEYMTLGQDTQAFLMSRIAFQARIAWDCEVGATDYVWVVQNLAATTAPTPSD